MSLKLFANLQKIATTSLGHYLYLTYYSTLEFKIINRPDMLDHKYATKTRSVDKLVVNRASKHWIYLDKLLSTRKMK